MTGGFCWRQKRSGLAALREAAAKDPGDWEIWFDIAAGTGGAEASVRLPARRR